MMTKTVEEKIQNDPESLNWYVRTICVIIVGKMISTGCLSRDKSVSHQTSLLSLSLVMHNNKKRNKQAKQHERTQLKSSLLSLGVYSILLHHHQ